MAVNQINSLQDLDKVINLDQPRPSIFQQKVIGFLLKYYWVRNDDNLNINRKINECLSRIEKLNNLYLESSLIPDPDDLLYHKMSSEILKIYATNQELKRQIDLLIKSSDIKSSQLTLMKERFFQEEGKLKILLTSNEELKKEVYGLRQEIFILEKQIKNRIWDILKKIKRKIII